MSTTVEYVGALKIIGEQQDEITKLHQIRLDLLHKSGDLRGELLATQQRLRTCKTEIAKLRAERNEARITAVAWKDLATARDDLLVCYRLGKRPSERLLRKLDHAKAVVIALTGAEGGDSGGE